MVLAYAAVLSLNRILEDISNSHLEQHQTPLQDQQIKSLQENLKFLLDFLDDSWQRRSEELQCLEREIRDAAYKIEDIVESHISKNFGQESLQERQIRDQTFCENFGIVAEEIDFIKTKAAITDLHHSQRTSLPTGPSRIVSSGNNAVVGFHKDLNQIMDRFDQYPPALQIIPVIGMGGIGKTTLAKNVYDHPGIAPRFDTRAWVTISQEYREREVLLSLLDSVEKLSAKMHQEDSGKLKEHLYKSLKGRRYLVVIDDVWTTEAWDSLSRTFPDDGTGSRIMMTSRLLSAIDSHSPPHHMQFLNETDSWNLLRREVFEGDSCPRELEEAGKKIAENCKGLPLSLVVIGGHLSKANKTKDYWEYVAQNVKSVVNATDGNCSEILFLSYDYLPPYLKACFLYMGVFPEDDEIRVSELIKLWVAEGFLKPVRGKTLEEVAEEYLGDLVSRNLIMISKKSCRGKIKTCSIHDMLRDLCLKKAQEEEFFIHVRDKYNIFTKSMKYSRRLCIHYKELKWYKFMGSLLPVRSILIPKSLEKSQITELVDGKLFPLLRVLNLKDGYGFPFGEIKLVHSRYIAYNCYQAVSMPKTLPDFLWYLQTLILGSRDVRLPEEIWRITQLRHLLSGKCYLPCPTRSPIAGENFVLGNLLTLSNVSISSRTKEVFERVPNLNKLGISNDYEKISLGILVNLSQLETLKICNFRERVRVPINFSFPTNIKKLTLQDCQIAWKHMTIVGSMPNLEVLKLLDSEPSEPGWDSIFIQKGERDWEPTEGEFCKLKFLLLERVSLEQWRANNTNFTSLECLKRRKCSRLKEIPPSFERILSLRIIDLDDYSPSAVISAKQIQQEQVNFGNDSLQVRVKRLFIPSEQHKELEAELIAKLESNDDKLRISACSELDRLLIFEIYPSSKGLKSRIVPQLLKFIGRDDLPRLQLEATKAIERISIHSSDESDNINILIEHNAVPIMVSLLSSPEGELRWKVIIDKGALPCLCEVLSPLTLHYHNAETDSDGDKETTCYIISNITGRTKDHIQAVIEAGVISPLLQLLQDADLQDADLFKAAAEVIYNVTTKGTNEQIKFLVQEGCIEPMCDLLVNPYEAHVIKICLEGLENILKVGEAEKNQGNTEDVNVFAQMIEDAGVLQKIKNLQTHDDSKIRRIAVKILVMYWHQEEEEEEDDDCVMMSTEDEANEDLDEHEYYVESNNSHAKKQRITK